MTYHMEYHSLLFNLLMFSCNKLLQTQIVGKLIPKSLFVF